MSIFSISFLCMSWIFRYVSCMFLHFHLDFLNCLIYDIFIICSSIFPYIFSMFHQFMIYVLEFLILSDVFQSVSLVSYTCPVFSDIFIVCPYICITFSSILYFLLFSYIYISGVFLYISLLCSCIFIDIWQLFHQCLI